MPEPTPGAVPPVAGAGTAPGQPPFGSSPLTMPVPPRGNQAASMALVRSAIELLTKSLPGFGVGSEQALSLMKHITALSKIAPAGSTSPGVQNTGMQNFMMQQRAEAPLLAALAQRSGSPGGASPPSPPGLPPPSPGGAPMTPGG